MWTLWTTLKIKKKNQNNKSHIGPLRFSLPYQHFSSKRKKQNKKVFFPSLFMFPHHLCVERFPVIWGEMLNGGGFSLQQESQNKMTNTSLKKKTTKNGCCCCLRHRGESDQEWQSRLQRGSNWSVGGLCCGSQDLPRVAPFAAETLRGVLVQRLHASADATWRRS